MGTMHEMSTCDSEQEGRKAWEECTLRPQISGNFAKLEGEAEAFDDQLMVAEGSERRKNERKHFWVTFI